MAPHVAIHTASLADVSQLAALARRTFFETFEKDNDPETMQRYLDAAFSTKQLAAELARPACTFFLATDRRTQRACGYAKLRAGIPDPSVCGKLPVEIQRLYVDRDMLGHGVGAMLMQACLDAANQRGFRTVWLGVWEHNPRALQFYAKWGFTTVGSHVFPMGADDQIDLILERPVSH